MLTLTHLGRALEHAQCCARLRALLAEGETDLGLVAEELLDQVCASLGSLRARARSRRVIALLATAPT